MTSLFQSRESTAEAAEKLKVFAHPQRLMILSCLLAGEASVGDIERKTGIGQPTLSQQLAELRRAALVETRRAAKQVYYRLANPDVALCLRSIEALFGGREGAASLSLAFADEPVEGPTLPTPNGAAVFARIL